ncbi:zinc finger protein 32-like, partial [Clarias magur]
KHKQLDFFNMESSEVQSCCHRKPTGASVPVGSQDFSCIRMKKCTVSGGTSSVEGHNLLKYIKKEEPANEECFCETMTGYVGHSTLFWKHEHVKKEEPEEKDYLCHETSSSVGNVVQPSGEFQKQDVKQEKSEDEHHPSTK